MIGKLMCRLFGHPEDAWRTIWRGGMKSAPMVVCSRCKEAGWRL